MRSGYRCFSDPGGFKLTVDNTQKKVDAQVEQIGQ
jgi:hypothetical protein